MSEAFNRTTKENPCPVCGRDRWCSVSTNDSEVGGITVHCQSHGSHPEYDWFDPKSGPSQSGGRFTRIGAKNWEERKTQAPRIKLPGAKADPAKIEGPRALSDDEKAFRHRVYSRLLELCPKDDSALADCAKWGVDPDSVRWGSLPGEEKLWEVLGTLRQEFGPDLLTVPGFISGPNDTVRLTVLGSTGLLVPSLDIEGNVRRLVRRDPDPNAEARWLPLSGWKHHDASKGASVGTPAHWARTPGPGCEVIVIEGERKSDRSAAKLESVGIVAVPGVGNWRASNLVGELKAVKAKKVFIAYDADSFENPNVARALVDLFAELKAQEFEAGVWAWSLEDGNGLDDLLLAGGEPKILEDEAANAWVKGLAERHGFVNTNRKETPEGPTEPAKALAERHGLPDWALPPGEPFPTHLLPELLAVMARALSAQMDLPENYLAPLILSICAGLIGSARWAKMSNTYIKAPIWWTIFLGKPSDGKSPAFNLLVKAIRQEITRRIKEHGKAKALYEIEKKAYKARANESEDEDVLELPPEEPRLAIPMVGDTTFDGMRHLLANNPKGLLVANDEIKTWFESFVRFATGGSDESRWLPLYDAAGGDSNRAGEGYGHFPDRGVVVVGGIQPGVLKRTLKDEHAESGLMSRLLLVEVPERLRKVRFQDMDTTILAEWDRLVKGLLALEGLPDANGDMKPIHVGMEPDGKSMLEEFGDSINYQKFVAEDDRVKADLGKLADLPVRLSVALCYSDRVANGIHSDRPMETRYAESAIGITKWFQHEKERLLSRVVGSPAKEAAWPKDAKVIHAAVQKSNSLSRSDISGLFGGRRSREALDASLSWLAERGLLRSELIQTGGAPKTMYLPAEKGEKGEKGE